MNDLLSTLRNTLTHLKKFIFESYNRKCDSRDTRDALYQLDETYKNADGQQILVVKILNTSGKYFRMAASKLVTQQRDLLDDFSTADIVNIVGLAAAEKEPLAIQIRNTPYQYFTLVAMLFGVVLVISNILSSKLVELFGYTMTGGQLIFPVSYALGNIITEVYGYQRARQLIWGAILCNVTFVIFSQLTILAPSSPYWHHQEEFALILGAVPRVIMASLIGYFCGEFINSYVLAKMKIASKGEHLWKRLIGSSTVAITISSLVFGSLAFSGSLPAWEIAGLVFRIYLVCTIYEIIALPLTCKITNFLKHKEKIDIYDSRTDFSPFKLEVKYKDDDNKYVQKNLSSSKI